MMIGKGKNVKDRLSLAGLLITLGIIYGDIGTSPLYVLQAIVGESPIDKEWIMGSLSCIFWTLLLITSFKYVYLALKADYFGEGGIFSLYALVRNQPYRWPLIAALIGCASLIADGFITPPISISSAVEGLSLIYPDLPTIPIVLSILLLLFIFQQFGTRVIGKVFGPIMLLWFTVIGWLGLRKVLQDPEILQAVNPYYAIRLLLHHPGGFWVLGAVFLCTTGAEALYADLGHCGKKNIQLSWVFVLFCLLLNYMGQSAWCIRHEGQLLNGRNVFYALVSKPYLPYYIVLATVATIIASQALISGCFTLISEAIKQRLWINLKVVYPAEHKGQVYIPAMNWVLLTGCICIIILFRKSSNMEAAYGLAITINMIMTTGLLLLYYKMKNKPVISLLFLGFLFFTLELTFLLSNLRKFFYGGWFTLFLALITFGILYFLHRARTIRDRYNHPVNLQDYIPMFESILQDETIPKTATNLVFMSSRAGKSAYVDSNVLFSVFQQIPKRADIYWFIHIDTLDYPHEQEKSYSVKMLIPGKLFFVRLQFGFKVKHKVNRLFQKVVEQMVQRKEVDEMSRHPSMRAHNIKADFKFIFVKPKLSEDNDLRSWDLLALKIYETMTGISYPPYKEFGLDDVNIEVELTPLHIHLSDDLIVSRKEGFE